MKCPKCGGKRHVFVEGKGWVRCSCVVEMRADRIMSLSKFPIPLQKVDAGSFKMPTKQRQALGEEIKKQIAAFDPQPIFIFSTSTEKDRVAAILSRYLIKQHSNIETVRYVSLDEMTENFFNREQPEEETLPLKEIDVLTISIGKEITNMAHRNILYNLLYDRILNERYTIIISSIPKMRIRAQYLENVDDLIQGNFKFFEC